MSDLTFTFDGINSETYGLFVRNDPRYILPEIENYTESIPGRPGVYDYGKKLEAGTLEIECIIEADTPEDLRQKARAIAAWLNTPDVRPLVFSDEPDKTYYARVMNGIDLERELTLGNPTITFIVPDPVVYGETKSQQVAGGEITDTESTDADWNESGAVLTATRADNGDLILADAGTTVQNIKDTQADWSGGSHNQTRAVATNGGALELGAAQAGGTTFTKTHTTQADWNRGSYGANTKASTVIHEDFEDTSYVFNFRQPSGSTAAWTRYQGSTLVDGEPTQRTLLYSYKAGTMTSTPGQQKYSRVDFDVTVPAGVTDAVLSLWYKVSSELNFDHFRIYVDKFAIRTEGKTGSNDTDAVLETSGSVKWTKWTYPLSPGTHTIRLEYHKDGATDGGQDTVWVDDIKLEYTDPAANNGVTLVYPEWDFMDSMASVAPYWTAIGNGVDDSPNGYITITSGTDGADGLDRQGVVPSFSAGGFKGFTLDILMDGSCTIYLSDGASLLQINPNIPLNNPQWVRMVIHADRTGSWWLNGVQQQSHVPLTSYTTNRILFYFGTTTAGTVNIHEVYYKADDLGPPGVQGTYTSEVMDISGVVRPASSLISWQTSGTGTGRTITLYTRLGTDDGAGNITWDGWQQATNGGAIPGISPGMDLTNKRLQYKADLSSLELRTKPTLETVSINIPAQGSVYFSSGTWESDPIDLSPAGVAKETNLIYSGALPDPDGDGQGIGSILVETNFAPDGQNYLGWKPATTGGTIPDIPPGTDLSTAKLKIRITLTTSDTAYSPYVSYLKITVTPGYAASGERIDAGTNVGEIGVAGDSSIEWYTADPADDVVVDYSFDKATWIECANGAEMPGIRGTNLTGKTIYFRQRLATDDRTKTPRLLSMTWTIFPQSQDPVVINGGTAQTFPKITVTFDQATDEITITNLTTGKFAKVEKDFTPGDVLVIDCDSGIVEVNGDDERKSFPIEADFFPLEIGENRIAVSPANVAVVNVEWTERWL